MKLYSGTNQPPESEKDMYTHVYVDTQRRMGSTRKDNTLINRKKSVRVFDWTNRQSNCDKKNQHQSQCTLQPEETSNTRERNSILSDANTIEIQGLTSWANESIAKEPPSHVARKQQLNNKVSIINIDDLPSRQHSLEFAVDQGHASWRQQWT